MSIIDYFRETRVEMGQVTWPSRAQTISYTIVVVVLSLVVAGLLGGFDLGFSWLLKLVWR